jgi:hypothetical protein
MRLSNARTTRASVLRGADARSSISRDQSTSNMAIELQIPRLLCLIPPSAGLALVEDVVKLRDGGIIAVATDCSRQAGLAVVVALTKPSCV